MVSYCFPLLVVFMNIQQVTVGSMEVFCYIVSCEKTKKAALIDAGGNEEMILAMLKKSGVDLQYIIATHGHPDHVCGNRKIKEATSAQIVMHSADAAFFSKNEAKSYFSMLGLEASPPTDITVEDGEIIQVGELALKVLHTPGHTPGGMCLYCEGNLFTGDTLFVGGMGRTDFPGGSHQELMDSIHNKIMTLPADTTVWPGHGYGGSQSTVGRENDSNPYL